MTNQTSHNDNKNNNNNRYQETIPGTVDADKNKITKNDFSQQFVSCCNGSTNQKILKTCSVCLDRDRNRKITRNFSCQSKPDVKHFSVQSPCMITRPEVKTIIKIDPSVMNTSTKQTDSFLEFVDCKSNTKVKTTPQENVFFDSTEKPVVEDKQYILSVTPCELDNPTHITEGELETQVNDPIRTITLNEEMQEAEPEDDNELNQQQIIQQQNVEVQQQNDEIQDTKPINENDLNQQQIMQQQNVEVQQQNDEIQDTKPIDDVENELNQQQIIQQQNVEVQQQNDEIQDTKPIDDVENEINQQQIIQQQNVEIQKQNDEIQDTKPMDNIENELNQQQIIQQQNVEIQKQNDEIQDTKPMDNIENELNRQQIIQQQNAEFQQHNIFSKNVENERNRQEIIQQQNAEFQQHNIFSKNVENELNRQEIIQQQIAELQQQNTELQQQNISSSKDDGTEKTTLEGNEDEFLTHQDGFVELDYSQIPAEILQQILQRTLITSTEQPKITVAENFNVEELKPMYFIVDQANNAYFDPTITHQVVHSVR